METAEAFDQTKENIQPLAQGRKTIQFEAALHAQNNAEAHQELNKIAQNYELALRTNDGEDPLALWYEYICWVEQSYPKGGKEGNILELLEKCLTHFKDAKRYFQDGRFIRLWIKYIDSNGVGNIRADLYRMAHCHGVGTQSALFYRFWAYELERSGDHKNADIIYRMGLDHNAQPKEELVNAHANFSAALAQMFLHGTLPSPQRPDASDRQVLAALRANGKNQVRNVRIGAPGNVRQEHRLMSLATNQVPQTTLKIFSDNGENVAVNVPSETMRALPKQSIINKENTMDAGPWTGPTRRKPRPAAAFLSIPSQTRPGFQVHTDDLPPAPREHPQSMVMNALRPIKDDFFESVPYAVFEDPNPMQRPMYPKDQVYAGGKEFSLEEIFAARWFKKEAARSACLKADAKAAEQARLLAEQKGRVISARLELPHGTSNDSIPSRSNNESFSLAAPQSSEQKKERFSLQSNSAALQLSFSDAKNDSATHSGIDRPALKYPGQKTIFQVNTFDVSSDNLQYRQPAHGPPVISREQNWRVNGRPAFELKDRLRESHISNESCSSNEPSMLHSQSITVNTKEAMSVMNELWGSTCDRIHQSQRAESFKPCTPGLQTNRPSHAVSLAASCFESVDENVDIQPTAAAAAQIPSFSIFSDCESEKNAVHLVQNELPVAAASHQSQSKENLVPTRKTSLATYLDENNDYAVCKLGNSIKKDFVIYQETEEEDPLDLLTPWPGVPGPQGIPIVPSPGMTPAQVRALKGTEQKENLATEPPPDVDRSMNGVLQPSIGIPFQPFVDPDPEEVANECDQFEVEPTEFFTQACTQAFKFPLSSSTPFHGNGVKILSPVTEECESLSMALVPVAQEAIDPLSPVGRQVQAIPTRTPTAVGPINLSIIMENSKELNYKSSSSSGSSSGTTTRRTFSVSQWSTQESMQRTGREKSLAAIQEQNRESMSGSSEPDDNLGCVQKEEVETGLVLSSAFSAKPMKKTICNRSAKISSVTAQINTDYKGDLFTLSVFDIQHESGLQPGYDGEAHWHKSLALTCDEREAENSISHYTEVSSQIVNKKVGKACDNLETSQNKLSMKDSGTKLYSKNDNKALQGAFPEEKSTLCPVGSIDPFNTALISELLVSVDFPGKMKSHIRLNQAIPCHWKPGSTVLMAGKSWDILGMVGKGAYAKVVKAMLRVENRCSKPDVKAFKIQKPCWVWESYISCQIHKRLDDESLSVKMFLKIDEFYEFNNGSVFTSDYYEHGTILSLANKIHSPANVSKALVEPVTMHFTMEMLSILEALHGCRIIHGDIKPDNFLLRCLLTKVQCEPTLQLIDYGRAIDLTLFPDGTTFDRVVTTQGFQCVEMQSDRPWTYQTDLYGLASTTHCLLMGEYMNVVCIEGVWRIKKKIPRSLKSAVWNTFFHTLLNIESCEAMPSFADLRANLELAFDRKRFASSVNFFNNLVIDQ